MVQARYEYDYTFGDKMRIAETFDDLPVGTQVEIWQPDIPSLRKGIVAIDTGIPKNDWDDLRMITILCSSGSLFHLLEEQMELFQLWKSQGGIDLLEIRIVEIK